MAKEQAAIFTASEQALILDCYEDFWQFLEVFGNFGWQEIAD